MIKKTLTLFALAGLAHIGMAQAAIPADVSAAPRPAVRQLAR